MVMGLTAWDNGPMKNVLPVLVRIFPRPSFWRVAVITPGQIIWRAYRRDEYPDADSVVRRCMAGLIPQNEPGHEADGRHLGNAFDCFPHASLPAENGKRAYEQNEKQDRQAPINEKLKHPAPRIVRFHWWGWL